MKEEIQKAIEEENWRKAKGVKVIRGETNSALATRDYSVKCKMPYLIEEVEGYYIWWCSTHHQPYAWCEKAKALKANQEDLLKKIEGMKEKGSVLESVRKGISHPATYNQALEDIKQLLK